MPIVFDRAVCCNLNETISREWLISNGRGGYAAGTVVGALTRMEHGLLVSSPLNTPNTPNTPTPQLLLAKIDEEIVFDERTYYLGTNEYRDGTLNPGGFVHLETFHLEEGFPVFTYRLGGIAGIMLEKRIWMPQGLNTTYIQYRVLRTDPLNGTRYSDSRYKHTYTAPSEGTLTLKLLPFSAYRPYNRPQYGNNDWQFAVQMYPSADTHKNREQPRFPEGVAACTIRATEKAHPYHLLAVGHSQSQTTIIPTGVWYWNFLRRHDQARGEPATDDLYLPGVIRTKLWPAEDCTLTIIVTAEELSTQIYDPDQIARLYASTVEQQRRVIQTHRYSGDDGETTQHLDVLPPATALDPYKEGGAFVQLLLQSGQRFLINRVLKHDMTEEADRADRADRTSLFFQERTHIPVILSDYYTMHESLREMLIALPGLTLPAQRYDDARRLLCHAADYFYEGQLPEHLPQTGRPLQKDDYSNGDTTLWYFYALDTYIQATHDYAFLDDVYQRLVDSIDSYLYGTSPGIRVDTDGLLIAQQTDKAMTWMHATMGTTVNGIAVTPRSGKAVEVNALWYLALSLMHEWSKELYYRGRRNQLPSIYQERSLQCKESFQQRFWNIEKGYLYDVVDGPEGDDPALRPNQLFALSLRYAVLDTGRQQAVFDAVTRHLLTPFGLRTLAPEETGYRGHMTGNRDEQQQALHQGSVWPWLLGPYLDAMFRIQETSLSSSNMQQRRLAREYVWRRGLQLLDPFRSQLNEGVLGMIARVFDGDAPYSSTSARENMSALNTGELLRMYHLLANNHIHHQSDFAIARRNR